MTEQKRPVGRPPKYKTEEERHEARKNQFRFYKKKVYENEKATRQAMPPAQKNLLTYLKKNVLTAEKANEILELSKQTPETTLVSQTPETTVISQTPETTNSYEVRKRYTEKGKETIEFVMDLYKIPEQPNCKASFIARKLKNGKIECLSDDTCIVGDPVAEPPVKEVIRTLFKNAGEIEII
jgi:hypothetical protein